MSFDEELKLPNYCDVYQTLTVEELALNSYPHKLHYGKCSVIGRTSHENGRYFLGNVRIENLEQEFRLPEGAVKVELFSKYYKSYIPVDTTCEIFGEVVLLNTAKETSDDFPKTSKELRLQIQRLQFKLKEEAVPEKLSEQQIQEEIEIMKKRYVPAIQVHSLNTIGGASELVECNLEIRMLRKLMQQKFGGKCNSNKC